MDRMTRSILATASVLLVLSASASAQLGLPFSINGRVRALDPNTRCATSATHTVECTDLLLRSDTVDLSALEGQLTQLIGQLQFSPTLCQVLVVENTETVSIPRTDLIALFGTRPGRRVSFSTLTAPGSVLYWFAAPGPARTPLPLGPFGTFALDPATAFFWTTDVSIGLSVNSFQIPNDPNLVGASLYVQVLAGSLLPTPSLQLLNPTCLTVR